MRIGRSAGGKQRADHASLEARELYAKLEAARIELESIRRGTRRLREELDPWLVERLGWPGTLSYDDFG